MVDYDYASGEGTLRIRDYGSLVEFWVKAGYTSFYWNGLDFNFVTNGATTSVSINYPSGADWKKVGSATVNSSQTVTFRLLTDTNTSSLGGPTTVSRFLDRGSVPDPPSIPTVTNITSTSMFVTFSDGDNGGLAIDDREIGYRRSTVSFTEALVPSDGSTSITGLLPGTTYYVYARTHNSKGWSSYGPVRTIKTLKVPDPPSTVTLSQVTQVSAYGVFKDNWNGGATVTARQIAYNTTNTTTGATIISSDGSTTITGLTPGTKYYFWARAFNSVGWSGWSAVASTTTKAGAFVTYGGVPKPAIPWVKDAGVWKVAKVWGRNGDIWKETAT